MSETEYISQLFPDKRLNWAESFVNECFRKNYGCNSYYVPPHLSYNEKQLRAADLRKSFVYRNRFAMSAGEISGRFGFIGENWFSQNINAMHTDIAYGDFKVYDEVLLSHGYGTEFEIKCFCVQTSVASTFNYYNTYQFLLPKTISTFAKAEISTLCMFVLKLDDIGFMAEKKQGRNVPIRYALTDKYEYIENSFAEGLVPDMSGLIGTATLSLAAIAKVSNGIIDQSSWIKFF